MSRLDKEALFGSAMIIVISLLFIGVLAGNSCASRGFYAEERRRTNERTCANTNGTWNEGLINGEPAWWCSHQRSER